jgi:hypothetical protein
MLPVLLRVLRRAVRVLVAAAVAVLLVLPAALSVVLHGSRYWTHKREQREGVMAT